MNALFADTSFFVAFLDEGDLDHDRAHEYMATHEGAIMTTDWVLAELGNFLSRQASRVQLLPFVEQLRADSRFVVCDAVHEDFQSGLQLYHERPDKHWSMTDCVSFTLMEREELTEALTSDHHFEQAGFHILLGN